MALIRHRRFGKGVTEIAGKDPADAIRGVCKEYFGRARHMTHGEIERADALNVFEYEGVREEMRRRVIALERARRAWGEDRRG